MSADPFAAVLALPGVAVAAVAAREAVDRVARHRAVRLDPGQVRAALAARAARASALLAGHDVDPAALRAGEAGSGPGAAVAGAAIGICAELMVLGPVWSRAPRQALARLHALAAGAAPDGASVGRPASVEAAARLDLLARALTEPTTAPAVVVAAAVHAEVLDSGAFGPAGGLVARAAQRLVLIGRGVDPSAVLAPELGHAALGLTEYQKALEDYRVGGSRGVARWVVHCARAIEVAALETSQVALVVRPGVPDSAYGSAQ